MTIKRSIAKRVSLFPLILAALFPTPRANAQLLTMDGESGIFLHLLAELIQSPQTSSVSP